MLDAMLGALDSMAITLGAARISMLGLLKAVALLIIMVSASRIVTSHVDKHLAGSTRLTPSAQVLFGKTIKYGLLVIAVMFALNVIGIDLTALAVFGGAVGLGIGIGLQRVVGNLVSGVILLLDKSVKPGDVIAIGSTFGWINSLNARYVSVMTRDGTEHLIPNEELMSRQVENWSHSNPMVRQKIPIGISYSSDPELARAIAVQAATETERVLENPKPVCHLVGFGDSSLDLSLRIWIRDPQNGIGNIKNAVLMRIWTLYNENGIEFPFPQRDVSLRQEGPLRIRVEAETPDDARVDDEAEK